MKCFKCGSEIPEGAQFCPVCGAKQEQKPAAPAKDHSGAISKFNYIFQIVLTAFIMFALVMAGIFCLTTLVRTETFDGVNSTIKSYGVFDYYFKNMWMELSNQAKGETNQSILLSLYVPAILSFVAVVVNIAVTLTMVGLGLVKGIQSLIKKSGCNIQKFGLIALLSNAVMGAILMMSQVNAYTMVYNGTKYNTAFVSAGLSTGLNLAISLLTIAFIASLAYRVYLSFDKKNVKGFIAIILIGLSFAFALWGMVAIGNSAYNTVTYTANAYNGYDTSSIELGILAFFSAVYQQIAMVAGQNTGILSAFVWIVLFVGLLTIALVFVGIIIFGTRFISKKNIRPLGIGITLISVGFFYLILDIVLVVIYKSVYGSPTDDIITFAGSGAISCFVLFAIAFGLLLASHILLKKATKPVVEAQPVDEVTPSKTIDVDATK